MAPRKTWIWIVVACLAVIVLGLFAIAGVGIYFVTRHIDTQAVGSADAMKQFDEVRAAFKDQQPLFELDANERPRATRPIRELPRSDVRPRALTVMAWDADEGRIVRISIPFWLLRLGGNRVEVGQDEWFSVNDFNLDVDQLERIGPALIFDYRAPSGERVLLWTQ